VHSAARILPSYNYCGNPAHKTSECNIPSKDLFCDYCGKEGHQEVVCFAKLPDKSSHNTSQAFLQQVLSRFKACAECLTDQGSEFRGKFQNLLNHALMDHRRTSRDHPEVDGLAKKMVQTCKKGFQKICFTKNKEDWDLVLLYIAMGYKMSKHASLSHFSPYFLLFGRHPIPPSSIIAQMDQVVDLDSPSTWARVIAKRAVLFKRVMPMAMENLSIAQHRDTLRYAHT